MEPAVTPAPQRISASPPADAARTLPKYGLHKASGQARVFLGGREIWLGPHNSPASRDRYDRLIAEWLACGRRLPPDASVGPRRAAPTPTTPTTTTVLDLIHAYRPHVEAYYVKHGRPTNTQANIRTALRRLRHLCGSTPVDAFGPLALKAVRASFVADGLCCSSVNYYTALIRACFKWGVAEELVRPETLQGLQAVAGLKPG